MKEKGIESVLSPGVSRAYMNENAILKNDTLWGNSGYGLYITSRLCARLGGEFRLLTSDHLYEITYDLDSESYVDNFERVPFKGCAVHLKFNVKHLSNYTEIYNLIMDEKEEMRKTKNSYSEASIYSKGTIKI